MSPCTHFQRLDPPPLVTVRECASPCCKEMSTRGPQECLENSPCDPKCKNWGHAEFAGLVSRIDLGGVENAYDMGADEAME